VDSFVIKNIKLSEFLLDYMLRENQFLTRVKDSKLSVVVVDEIAKLF